MAARGYSDAAVQRRPGRRVAAVAVMGLLAVGVLAGCRSEPGTAAFVANTRITDAQVNAEVPSLVTDLKRFSSQQAAANGQAAPPFDRATALNAFCGGELGCRQSILQYMVSIQVLKRYLNDHKSDKRFSTNGDPLGQAQQKLDQLITSNKVPPGDLYLRTRFTYQAYLEQLTANLPADVATNAELMSIYQRVKDEGLTSATFDQVKPTLQGLQGLGQSISATRLLAGVGQTYDVDVSPRYIPTPVAGEPNFGFQIPTLQVSDQQGGEHTILGVTTNTVDAIAVPPSNAAGTSDSQPGAAAP